MELTDETNQVAAPIKAPASQGSGPVGRGGLVWPAIGPITSGFAHRRDLVLGKYALHAGIDIDIGDGTPIHAAQAGTVIFASQESGYGTYPCLDHGGGFSACYVRRSSCWWTWGRQSPRGT